MKRNFFLFLISAIIILFTNINVLAHEPYRITEYKEGIYVVEINTDKSGLRLMPYFVEGLENNSEVFKNSDAKLVVNAGFFDPKNKKTVSYVVIDTKTVLNPEDNEALMQNRNLKPYLDKILNRSEFRILEDEKGKILYDITSHNTPVKEGLKLIHSVQAGPMLYPDLRLEEEFFILVKDGELRSESASCLHPFARTAIGIKKNKVYIFIATKEAPLTLKELSDITRIWGVEKAMAFDGGGSTSLDCKDLHIISDYANEGRKLKSFLILK